MKKTQGFQWEGNEYRLVGLPEQGRIAPCYKWDGALPYKVIAHVWGPQAESEATESLTILVTDIAPSENLMALARAWVERRVKFLNQ